jgi:hypothetical protein
VHRTAGTIRTATGGLGCMSWIRDPRWANARKISRAKRQDYGDCRRVAMLLPACYLARISRNI